MTTVGHAGGHLDNDRKPVAEPNNKSPRYSSSQYYCYPLVSNSTNNEEASENITKPSPSISDDSGVLTHQDYKPTAIKSIAGTFMASVHSSDVSVNSSQTQPSITAETQSGTKPKAKEKSSGDADSEFSGAGKACADDDAKVMAKMDAKYDSYAVDSAPYAEDRTRALADELPELRAYEKFSEEKCSLEDEDSKPRAKEAPSGDADSAYPGTGKAYADDVTAKMEAKYAADAARYAEVRTRAQLDELPELQAREKFSSSLPSTHARRGVSDSKAMAQQVNETVEVRRYASTPGAFAVRGSAVAGDDNRTPPGRNDSFSSQGSGQTKWTAGTLGTIHTPRIVAHLVGQGDEENRESEVIHAVAKKDSFLELLRHDRKTKIVTGFVVLAIIALGVTLGVTLSRPPPSPQEEQLMMERYMPIGSELDGPNRAFGAFEYGSGEYSQFGTSVSLSRNGTRVAIGAPNFSPSEDERKRGLVQVYEEEEGDWKLLEPSILGDAGEMAGSSVALSLDGNTIAIGSPELTMRRAESEQENEAAIGQVKVYKRVGDSWKKLGRTIFGESANDRLGSSVGISEDGRRVAVSVPSNVRGANEKAKVFEYVNDDWVQLGDDLEGRFGGSPISMSADGNTVAMGSLSMAENNDMGAVRVYTFVSGRWVLKGSDIMNKGAQGSYDTNWTPSISADGKTVAIGTKVMNADPSKIGEEYDLLVRVFRFSEETGDWEQLGDTLHDKKGPHLIAYVASLSADSKILTIGDPGGFATGINSGHTHVLRLIDDNWIHIDKELDGFDAADRFGHSVSVSADGSRVAVGAPKCRALGLELGRVSVYEMKELVMPES